MKFKFTIQASVFTFCLFACLGEGFAANLSASGPFISDTNNATAGSPPTNPSAVASPLPKDRALAEPDLLELLSASLQTDYVKDKGQLDLHFTQPWKTRTVPEGPLTLKILELPNAGVTSAFIVRFEILSEGKSLGTWQISATAKVWREVWIARSALKTGGLISEADLARERRDMLAIRDAVADFAEGDTNLLLAEPLQAGSPLLARSVKLRPIIHRGQTTEAVFQSGALSVSMKVEALEDGVAGQVIRARNPVSLRNVRGKVLSDQTILVSM